MAQPPPLTGRSVARLEDERLVTGGATYVADLDDPRLAGRAQVVFVRSPHAHAEVLSVEADEARRAPGVVDVVTAAEVDAFPPGAFAPSLDAIFAQPLLAEQRVRFVGEPVAAVVAESLAAAVDAAELVEVEYSRLEPVLDLDDAAADRVVLFPPGTGCRLQPGDPSPPPSTGGPGTNTATDTGWVGSDRADPSPFDQAEVVVRQRVMNPRLSPAPIEPRATTAVWTGPDELVVWAASQRPHGVRDELCALYGLDRQRVTVIAGPDVGGGFGGKTGRSPEERIIPLLARRAQRPVSWIETRSEYLAAGPQGRGEQVDIELAATAEGRLVAVRAELIKDAGAYPMTGALLPAGYTVPCAIGPYDIGHAEIRAVAVATNRVPTSAYRGAGRAPYLAALEVAVDQVAAATGIDPAEVRRRNLLRPDQLPHETPTGSRYDEADYPADLERALTAAGYDQLRADQARRDAGADPDARRLGIGVASYNYITVGGGGEEASVTLLPDGRARVVTGTTSQGHGHTTTWAQLAADTLGMGIEQIEVVEGRTDLIGSGVGAVGSRSAQTAGMAIHRSATALVDEALALAAELLEASPADVVLDREGARFHVVGTPAVALTWAAIAASASAADRELACGDFYDTEGVNTYPSGTHLAVVEVDPATGAVELTRFVAVDDAGARINPMIVEGQLHGGIAAGISQALGEACHYDDDGNLLTATFLDYTIATADQLPSFELVAGEVPTSVNVLGLKGVGESGTIGATPAVHLAVLDAIRPLGVDHLDLPCTPERVWATIEEAREAP